MEEEADLVLVAAIAQRLGERQQMIVVHPDDVVGPQDVVELVGEIFVDPDVAGQIAAQIFGKVESVVQQRPERPIGEAVVVLLVVGAGEIGGDVGDAAVLDGAALQIVAVGDAAAPAEPDAAVALEERRRSATLEGRPARVAPSPLGTATADWRRR